ncbi:hypothetical protein [Saccharopolyspora sp. NPDC002376]
MPLFSGRGRSERPSGGRGGSRPVGPDSGPFSVETRPRKPAPPVQRRNDHKLLVLAGIGGLVLIAAPIVVFSQLADQVGPGGVPAGSEGSVMGEYDLEEPYPASPLLQVSPLPGASSRLDGSGRVVLAATSASGSVLISSQMDGSQGPEFNGWVDLGGSAAGDPVLVTNAIGEMTAFAVGTDGHLRQNRGLQPAVDGESEWRDLGGERLVGMPAVAQGADGKLVVAARGADGSLQVIQQTAVVADTWGGWQRLRAPAAHDPALYRDSHGKLRIFASGPDGQLRTISQASTSAAEWNVPQDLGGSVAGPPAVVMDLEGRLRVFALRADGSLAHNVEADAASNAWVGWADLGGQLEGKPFATVGRRGGVAVHVLDRHGTLREVYQAGVHREKWSGWQDRGGSAARAVSVIQDAQGRFVVHAIGRTGGMERAYQRVPSSSDWSGWATDLGGAFRTG